MVEIHVPVATNMCVNLPDVVGELSKIETPSKATVGISDRQTIVALRRQIGSITDENEKLKLSSEDDRKVINLLLAEVDGLKNLSREFSRQIEEDKKLIEWHDMNDEASWDTIVESEKKYKKLKKKLKVIKQLIKC